MSDLPFGPPLGAPHHHGYVVESIEATVERLVGQLGAGPFLLIENVPLEDVRSGDEEAVLDHDSAFGSCGGFPLELIEVKRAAPARVEERWGGSLPRIHHVAFVVPPETATEVRAGFEERGLPQYLSSRLGEVDNSFHDGSAVLGHDIEIQVDAPAFREFFAMILAAAEDWDGSEPLRPVVA